MLQANNQFKSNTIIQNNAVWGNACNIARRRLHKAQQKSGYAILGSPPAALLEDPKFQGEYGRVAVVEGEKLAHATLASEIFVLNLAGIDPCDRYKYTGRSQYPKFVRRPVVSGNSRDSKYHSSDFQSIVKVLNLLQIWADHSHFSSDLMHDLSLAFLPARDSSPGTIRESIDALVAGREIEDFLNESPPEDSSSVLSLFEQARDLTFNTTFNKCNKEWRAFGKEQFSGHATAIFSYISKDEKQYLSPDKHLFHNNSFDPDTALRHRSHKWASFWKPSPTAVDPQFFVGKFHRLWDYCRKSPSVQPPDMTPEVLDLALGKYRKKTKGIDNSLASELTSFPPVAKQAQCDAYRSASHYFVLPHQHLLTLSVGLGKPSGDIRTIAKTCMWYRCLCRSDSSVAEWGSMHTAPFDTAGKGKSAIVALSVRNLKAEVGNALGYIVVGAFNDIN